jgi:hypothetical protein
MSTQADHGHELIPRPEQTPDALRAALAVVDPSRLEEMQSAFGASAFGLDAEEQGLPVLVVDEEIYRHPPSLVIATVDEFAQLPWKGDTQALFGQVSRRCTRHGPRPRWTPTGSPPATPRRATTRPPPPSTPSGSGRRT